MPFPPTSQSPFAYFKNGFIVFMVIRSGLNHEFIITKKRMRLRLTVDLFIYCLTI